jgi:hypothetical protein
MFKDALFISWLNVLLIGPKGVIPAAVSNE